MARTNKLRGGRGVKIKIDTEALQNLAKIQCTYAEAAAFFDCDEKTIKRRLSTDPQLRECWDRGKELGRISLRRLEWRHAQMATSGGVTMTIHLARQHLGETERAALELSGRVDGTLEVNSARERVGRKLDGLAERIEGRVASIAVEAGATTVPRQPVG